MRNDVMNYDVISHTSQIETRNFAEKREKTLEKGTTHQSQRRTVGQRVDKNKKMKKFK